ncbi:MAG TPA: hypothetical protein VFM63_01350 [Pyrinomonadaceae bacterium]|nr:hypothetical protein [Pyrinomonadaceae bacterium]
MTRTAIATIAILALVAIASFTQAVTNVASSPKVDMFFGTSPCAEFVKPKLRIPAGENCDRIKWHLSIFESGKYSLRQEWGYHIDNRTYLSKGKFNMAGTWKIAKGRTGDPNGAVVQLDADQPNSIAFALIDKDILHLLDANNGLAVGDSGQSYTLSRLAMGYGLPATSSGLSTDADSTAEINFSGRTPCIEIAKEIKHPVPADCAKLKWSIDLYRDPQTLAPTTYRLRSTLYRHEPNGTEIIREGKWKVTKGTKTDKNAIVYQLDAFEFDGPIFLLKADPNVLFFLGKDGSLLVGDTDFSYTLNRGTVKRPTTTAKSQ